MALLRTLHVYDYNDTMMTYLLSAYIYFFEILAVNSLSSYDSYHASLLLETSLLTMVDKSNTVDSWNPEGRSTPFLFLVHTQGSKQLLLPPKIARPRYP